MKTKHTVRSMTGFGVAEGTLRDVVIRCQLRTVNHRYFEWKPKIPGFYFPLEHDLKECIRKHVTRGVIDLTIRREVHGRSQVKFLINEEAALAAADGLKVLAKKMGISLSSVTDASMMDWVLRFPQVHDTESIAECSDEEREKLLEVAEEALAQLNHKRDLEGEHLKEHCFAVLKDLEKTLISLEKRVPEVPQLWFEKLKTRLSSWEMEGLPSTPRLEQELAMMAERSDVTEEVVRLKHHLKMFRDMLDHLGPKGKKLDFYVQEIHREINTLGSKLADSTVATLVTQFKVSVEQLREQIQNVE